MIKEKMRTWIVDAIKDNDGAATIVEVAQHVWKYHQLDLQTSGDFFYTWQYDMRWIAQDLRDKGVLAKALPSEKRWKLME